MYLKRFESLPKIVKNRKYGAMQYFSLNTPPDVW